MHDAPLLLTNPILPAPAVLQDTDTVEVVLNHAVKIPVDAAAFGPDALDQVAAGKYARRQCNSGRGAGFGNVVGYVAQHCKGG